MKTKSILFSLALSVSGSLYAQVNLTNGLTACYSFDGNANDMSGNSNHGTVTGATLVADRSGTPSGAYSFNGTNNYIEVTNPVVSSGEFSISFWAKTDQYKNHMAFMLIPDNVSDRFSIAVNYNHSADSAIFWDFGDIFGNGRSYTYPTTFIGVWEHYVFITSVAKDSMLIYRNNVLLSGVKQSDPLINTGRTLRIGSGNNANYFNGALDDIRLYNRTLNTAEISALYNNQLSCSAITSVSKHVPSLADHSVYPNPSSGSVTLKVAYVAGKSFSFEIFDLSGKKVREILNIQGSEILIEREALENGFYLYQLSADGEFFRGKLIFN